MQLNYTSKVVLPYTAVNQNGTNCIFFVNEAVNNSDRKIIPGAATAAKPLQERISSVFLKKSEE